MAINLKNETLNYIKNNYTSKTPITDETLFDLVEKLEVEISGLVTVIEDKIENTEYNRQKLKYYSSICDDCNDNSENINYEELNSFLSSQRK